MKPLKSPMVNVSREDEGWVQCCLLCISRFPAGEASKLPVMDMVQAIGHHYFGPFKVDWPGHWKDLWTLAGCLRPDEVDAAARRFIVFPESLHDGEAL